MATEETHHLLPQLLVNNNQFMMMMMNMDSIDNNKLSNGNFYTNDQFAYTESWHNNNIHVSKKRSRDNNSYFNSQTTFLGQDIMISSLFHQQQFEIDQFLKHHSENVRLKIDAKRRRTSRTLIAALEEGLQHRLRAKEDEITKMMKLNHALQEKVKTMCIENQIWRELAQTNEATANVLRNNLKYVLDCKLGDDVVAAEDVESCCESSNEEYISLHDSTTIPNPVSEDNSLGKMLCKNCRKEESNVLVLPCRHLCLCSGCALSIDVCPVCKSTKNFTLNVHLS